MSQAPTLTVAEFLAKDGRLTHLRDHPHRGGRVVTVAYYETDDAIYYGATVFKPDWIVDLLAPAREAGVSHLALSVVEVKVPLTAEEIEELDKREAELAAVSEDPSSFKFRNKRKAPTKKIEVLVPAENDARFYRQDPFSKHVRRANSQTAVERFLTSPIRLPCDPASAEFKEEKYDILRRAVYQLGTSGEVRNPELVDTLLAQMETSLLG